MHTKQFNFIAGPRWDELIIGGVLGKGGSADVHLCTTHTDPTPRAIKLYSLKTRQSCAELTHEQSLYHRLLPSQGELVARVYATDIISPSGSTGGFILDVCLPMPHTYLQWSYEDRLQPKRQLKRLSNEYHVIQNDSRPQNFAKDATGKILVVDLAQAQRVAEKRTRAALRKIFRSN